MASALALSSSVLSLWTLPGCAVLDENEEHIGSLEAEGRRLNGRRLNGRRLNGRRLNGTSFEGAVHSVRLDGVTLGGAALGAVTLDRGSFASGQRRGVQFAGAVFNGVLDNGSTLPLRVDAVREDADDLLLYTVSYQTDAGWQPLCADAAGNPGGDAYAIDAVWDYREGVPGGGSSARVPGRFTFACTSDAVGKCVSYGYVPWREKAGTGQTLADHHQACTRMVRADYCGDGSAGTMTGWQINVYDGVGIETDTESGAEWVFEAAWTAGGAACVDEYRALELVLVGEVPECALSRITDTCSKTPLAGSVLLKTEYDSEGLIPVVQSLVNDNPKSPLADKVEDAIAKLDDAFAELDNTASGRIAALDKFRAAADEIDHAVEDDLLDADYGLGLLGRIGGVARAQVTATLAANECSPKKSTYLTQARTSLAQGDILRASGRVEAAIEKYRVAVERAGQAGGKPCSP
jgi:ADYC domain